jgi:hypothetical protein
MEDKLLRSEEIAKKCFIVGRSPDDTAGLDTDDEIWMEQNKDCDEYIINHFKYLNDINIQRWICLVQKIRE